MATIIAILKKFSFFYPAFIKKLLDKKALNMLEYKSLVKTCGCGGTGRRAGLRNQCQRRGGSSPFIRTNDVSVRTNRTELIQNQSENKSG